MANIPYWLGANQLLTCKRGSYMVLLMEEVVNIKNK